MKKSISINIKGSIFNIEEDAYKQLKTYLESVKDYFVSFEDSDEIINDIENRIAEIFHNTLLKEKREVITNSDVEQIIQTMGETSDFDADVQQFEYEEESNKSQDKSEKEYGSRRLFKDGKRKIIAGVAAGIGHYFKVDPMWIRLIFLLSLIAGGFGFILYLILLIILPESDELEESPIKKLFRDGENKIIGGVASGLSQYVSLDPVWLRLLFVLSIFLGGSGIIIYLVLWMILPEANSLSEKMQMQGESITLANIEKNIKENLKLKDDNGEESLLAKILLFPFRVGSLLITGLGRILRPLLTVFVEILRISAGVLLTLVGLSFIFLFLLIAAAGLGLVTTDALSSSHIPLDLLQNSVPTFGVIALFLVTFFPLLFVIFLGFSLLSKKNHIKPIVFGTLFGVWVLCITLFVGSAAYIGQNFIEEGSFSIEQKLNYSSEAPLVIRLNKAGNTNYHNIELNIKSTSDSLFSLKQEFSAQGKNRDDATENAKMVDYHYNMEDSLLVFDSNFDFSKNAKFRVQKLEMTLYVPQDRKIIIDEGTSSLLRNFDTENHDHRFISDRHIWLASGATFKCIDCPDNSFSRKYIDKPEHDLDSKHFKFSEFQAVRISDAFEVEIHQGEKFKVIAKADQEALESINAYQKGGKIYFSLDQDFFDYITQEDNIMLYIEVPKLEEIELSGAVDASINIVNADRLSIELNGACKAMVEASDIEDTYIRVSGASNLIIEGRSNELEVDISGASGLEAQKFYTQNCTIEASGASHAEVHVSENLNAEVDGASNIRYSGFPNVQSDVSGIGSLKQVD